MAGRSLYPANIGERPFYPYLQSQALPMRTRRTVPRDPCTLSTLPWDDHNKYDVPIVLRGQADEVPTPNPRPDSPTLPALEGDAFIFLRQQPDPPSLTTVNEEQDEEDEETDLAELGETGLFPPVPVHPRLRYLTPSQVDLQSFGPDIQRLSRLRPLLPLPPPPSTLPQLPVLRARRALPPPPPAKIKTKYHLQRFDPSVRTLTPVEEEEASQPTPTPFHTSRRSSTLTSPRQPTSRAKPAATTSLIQLHEPPPVPPIPVPSTLTRLEKRNRPGTSASLSPPFFFPSATTSRPPPPRPPRPRSLGALPDIPLGVDQHRSVLFVLPPFPAHEHEHSAPNAIIHQPRRRTSSGADDGGGDDEEKSSFLEILARALIAPLRGCLCRVEKKSRRIP